MILPVEMGGTVWALERTDEVAESGESSLASIGGCRRLSTASEVKRADISPHLTTNGRVCRCEVGCSRPWTVSDCHHGSLAFKTLSQV